jgi:thiamine biosynthesis lipoprotein
VKVVVAWLSVLAISLVQAEEEKFRFTRPQMGTRFTVVCYAQDHNRAEKVAAAAFAQAEAVNKVASDYLPESELSRLSHQPAGEPIRLSAMLFDLLENARAIAEETQGAYDPTLGPLTKLWRASWQTGLLPTDEARKKAMAAVGWRHFTLDAASRTITLHRRGMMFDLGGIAKGYAADLMLASLHEQGVAQAMIVAGGDIRVGAPPPGRDGWRVAVKTFDQEKHDEILTLRDGAVSTSGDLYQMIEIDGVRYSHIVDPVTGLGLSRRTAAVVIADQGKISDPLATALCVIGEKGVATLRKRKGVREIKVRTWQDSRLDSSQVRD